MNDHDLRTFERIVEKSNRDRELWNQTQDDESIHIPQEVEEEIMERMFLVYYVKKYIELTSKETNVLSQNIK